VKFSELTSLALLGTERQELPRAVTETTVGALQSQLDFALREKAFLSVSALAGGHERVGRLPSTDSSPGPAPSNVEIQQCVSAASSAFLLRMLAGEYAMLLSEWLNLAAQAQRLAPPEFLPALLNAATNSLPLRETALPVIGARGLWLAAQNPEWAWVLGSGEDENIWQTGDTPARALFLRHLRAKDPDRARDLVAAIWKNEAPEERATFLNAFMIGLGTADEAFLENALDDKRKEVRRTASKLLVRLPTSALVSRMKERVTPLLRFIPGESGNVLRLKRGRAAALEVTLPQACDKPMQRDGIELKAPQGMGEKAAWLVQLLEAVPLDHWQSEWKTTPDQIIEASLAGEWKLEMLEGWTRAAVLQDNADWAETLLKAAVGPQTPDRLRDLLACLPTARREAQALQWFGADNPPELQRLAVTLLTHSWSPDLSRAVVAWLRQQTAVESTDWQFRNDMKNLATRIHPEVLPEVTRDWPEDSAGWNFWSKGVDELLSVVQFRHQLVSALQQDR